MQTIVELRAGAHLYGTATPASDTDLKAVHIPPAADILLQRVRPTLTTARPARNQPTDTDRESHSLHRFLHLVGEGQPAALEMLFAPDDAMTAPPDPLWREVQALAPRLVSRRATVFLSYARQQAERYGAKGARAQTVRGALSLLMAAEARHGASAPLSLIEPDLAAFAAAHPHAALVDLPIGGDRVGRHLDLCGRRAPLHASLKWAREMAARLAAEYGARANAAGEGVDWKAMSHAVRVGVEALELLDTGRLRFPLASAPHLLAIKLGRVPYDSVAAEVERLLSAVSDAAARSTLPDEPDMAAAEALVLRAYRAEVLRLA